MGKKKKKKLTTESFFKPSFFETSVLLNFCSGTSKTFSKQNRYPHRNAVYYHYQNY